MKSRAVAYVFLLIAFIFAGAGCSKEQTQSQTAPAAAPAPTPPQPMPEAAHSQALNPPPPQGTMNSAAGIEWTVPQGWTSQEPRSMRVATYSIPPASGDAEGAECAVFFFGSGQGGDVRSNIDRWVSQFQTDSKPTESSKTVNGIRVTTVSVSGTYLAPSGPMMQSQGQKSNYRLLGAIVEAPEGAVFFKTTGPAATIAASEKDFASLVDSVKKPSI